MQNDNTRQGDHSSLNILIIGGGIAGLSAALFLERKGFNVEIVERSKEPNCSGGGITLTFNGVMILNTLGLGKKLESLGAAINSIEITNSHSRRISSFNVSRYNDVFAKTISIHRGLLLEMLIEKLATSVIHYNTTFESIINNEKKVKVAFSNGQEKQYDLVIGCDGMNSSVRKQVFGDIPARFSGYSCWRFIVDDYREADHNTIKEMWGRGKRIGIVPINKTQTHCFASVNTMAASEKYKNISLNDFKHLFREFNGVASSLIDKLYDRKQLYYSDLGDIYLDKWINNRIVLIGDAAHGMTPNMAQGASMAMEDAMLLSQYLSSSVLVTRSLEDFFNARKKRVTAIQNRSNLLGKIGQVESRFLSGLRNFCWSRIPDKWIQKDFEKILV